MTWMQADFIIYSLGFIESFTSSSSQEKTHTVSEQFNPIISGTMQQISKLLELN